MARMSSSRYLYDKDEKKMYVVYNNNLSNLPIRGYVKRVYTQNFVLTNLPTTKMVKSKDDMGKEWYLCACFNVCDFINYNNVGS